MTQDTPRTASRQIILHLGAHKTATTHLQQGLKRALPRLVDTAVFLPDDLRKNGLRLQDWLGLRSPDPQHEAQLRAAFDLPAARLVLSEENALGQVPGPELAGHPVLYPQAASRLARLRTLLPQGAVTLALGVREGAGFLASCYSQALMAGRVAPFEAMFGGMDPAALSWSDLADRLMVSLPGARLVVWDHADWPAVAPQVAAALLGPDAAPLRLPDGRSHPGLSGAAVAALLAGAPRDTDAARAMARDLRARMASDAGHAPYDPWNAALRQKAARAHATDLARLAGRADTTLIWPVPG